MRVHVVAKLALLAVGGLLIAGAVTGPSLTAPVSKILELRDLTWVEVRSAIDRGYTTVIVPTGGIEQNGPHMVLGKHDYIVSWAAKQIAAELGQTLVAPVVSYVPEGDYEPATGHLRFPGTIGVPAPAFGAMLDGIARSLKAGGFTTICFIGDHGDSQAVQREVAQRLTREWAAAGVRVVHIDAYYDDRDQIKRLQSQGETLAAIGEHAGIIDTSELMAVHPAGVDLSRYLNRPFTWRDTGASGDPARASPERGRALIQMRIKAAVQQINASLPDRG